MPHTPEQRAQVIQRARATTRRAQRAIANATALASIYADWQIPPRQSPERTPTAQPPERSAQPPADAHL
jgi:hypothetical protein